jgi:hypothetical protein
MPSKIDRYRILIDREWLLTDLYRFPHVYFQVYSLIGALQGLKDESVDWERVTGAFYRYPWRGGYSAVNFYQNLYAAIPKTARPRIAAIRYESPGYIDLALWTLIAVSIKRMVKAIVDSAGAINDLYTSIYKGLHDRRLMRLDLKEKELQLTRQELQFVRESMDDLANAMQFKEFVELKELGPNELSRLKILLSLYRRLRVLAQYSSEGKVEL